MLLSDNIIYKMGQDQRKKKSLGVVEETSYEREHLTCISKDNLKLLEEEDSKGPARQRNDCEQRHRGIKKMALFIKKKGFQGLDHTLSTAWGMVGEKLIL